MMEPRTHRISIKIEPKGLQSLLPTSSKGLCKMSPFQVDFEKELDAFKQKHPTARVPADRQPELIAYGKEAHHIVWETMTYHPEDFNKRVLEKGDFHVIQRGVDLAIRNEAKRHPMYQADWLHTIRLVRSLVRRVDVQFAFVET